MVRQKVLRKIELDEHITPEVLNLLSKLGALNDVLFEERLKAERLGNFSNRKRG